MKKILLIILLSFVSVVGAIGLMVGGMYLVGGFNEKIVYAEDLAFSETQIISNDTFYLRVATTTEDVTQTRVKLYTSPGGESVIDFPEYVRLNEYFTVIPKQDGGINFGGNVTLYASYDGDSSSQIAPAECKILIDVPVEKVASVIVPQSTVGPNQILTLARQGDKISDFISIYPAKALMPYRNFGTRTINNIEDKKIFLQLTDANGGIIKSNVAQFQVNGNLVNTNLDGVLTDTPNIIEVRYEYNPTRSRIEFTDTISVETKGAQAQIKVNAYVYSTYQEQQESFNDNSKIESVVASMSSMGTNSVGFAIGNYEINSFVFDNTVKDVFLNLTSNYDGATNIYLNNPNVVDSDINLALDLQSSSANIDLRFNMYNMYLGIENENNDDNSIYWLLFNEGIANSIDASELTNSLVRNKYDNISTEKEDWCWKLKINNFLAYKNYVDEETRLKATLVYIEYVKDAEGFDTTVESKRITKTFYIIPRIIDVEELKVNYIAENSVKVKSGAKLKVTQDNIVQVDTDGFITNAATVQVNPENATINGVRYYLSYGENYGGILTKPTTLGGTYKATFQFQIGEDNDLTQSQYTSISKFSNSGWGDIIGVSLKQDGKGDFSSSDPNTADATGLYNKNKPIYAEIEISVENNSTIPSDNEIFIINFNDCSITIYLNQIKFYESVSGRNYSNLPYLAINGIRYYTDYDYYTDEITLTNFLRIPFENTIDNGDFLKVEGIGSFKITAQLCYVDPNGKIYWLDKSRIISIDAYEDLENINVYSYTDAGKASFSKSGTYGDVKFGENSETTYYMFINSKTMQTLNNYVNFGQVEIFAKQVFYQKTSTGFVVVNEKKVRDSALDTYHGIYDINNETISFGNFIAVEGTGGVVTGYKIAYTIGEVKTIVIDDIEYEPLFEIVIRAMVNGSYINAKFEVGDVEQDELIFEVTDRVLTSSTITYNGTTTSASSPLGIYAGYNSGNIVYKAMTNSSTINFGSYLKYSFLYNDNEDESRRTPSTDALSVRIDLDNGINQEGLLRFDSGVLTLNNFPYFEDGVLLTLTIEPTSMIDSNSYYLWDNFSQTFVQTCYNLTKSFYVRVWGLKINVEVSESIGDIYGKKDVGISLFGTGGIFNFNVQDAKNVAINTASVADYSIFFGIDAGSTTLVINEDSSISDMTIENCKILNPNKDVVEDSDIWFKFYVGSNANSNIIKIKNVGADTATLNTFTKTIKSPYLLNTVATAFTAPSSNQTLVELNYIGSGSDTVLLNVTVISKTLNNDYGITDPIVIDTSVSGFVRLTFKSVPEDYSAVVNVRLTITSGDVNSYRDKVINITVTNAFSNSDIKINPVYDEEEEVYVDLDEDGYCNIVAGVEYSYARNNSISNTIKLDGLLADSVNAWIDKLTSMTISFADVTEDGEEEIIYPLVANLMTHRYSIGDNTNFVIGSHELNVSKKISIIFEMGFNDGGFIIITKYVKVAPNITLELTVSNITEGGSIILSNNNTYRLNGVVGAFDIDNNFEPDGSDIYSPASFEFDSNVFVATAGEHSYTISARRPGSGGYLGAATASNGRTQIVLYYRVSSGNGYLLRFVFDLNVFFETDASDIDLTLNAGAENTVGLTGRLLQLKDNVEEVDVNFYDASGNPDALISALIADCSVNFSEQTGKLNNIVITAEDYNQAVDIKIVFEFTYNNGQHVIIEKLVTLVPNISLQIGLPKMGNYSAGETINLNSLSYVFTVNNQENSAYRNQVLAHLELYSIDTACLTYDYDHTITINNDAYVNSGDGTTNFVYKYDVCDANDSSIVLYTMYFTVEVPLE